MALDPAAASAMPPSFQLVDQGQAYTVKPFWRYNHTSVNFKWQLQLDPIIKAQIEDALDDEDDDEDDDDDDEEKGGEAKRSNKRQRIQTIALLDTLPGKMLRYGEKDLAVIEVNFRIFHPQKIEVTSFYNYLMFLPDIQPVLAQTKGLAQRTMCFVLNRLLSKHFVAPDATLFVMAGHPQEQVEGHEPFDLIRFYQRFGFYPISQATNKPLKNLERVRQSANRGDLVLMEAQLPQVIHTCSTLGPHPASQALQQARGTPVALVRLGPWLVEPVFRSYQFEHQLMNQYQYLLFLVRGGNPKRSFVKLSLDVDFEQKTAQVSHFSFQQPPSTIPVPTNPTVWFFRILSVMIQALIAKQFLTVNTTVVIPQALFEPLTGSPSNGQYAASRFALDGDVAQATHTEFPDLPVPLRLEVPH